MSTRRDVLGVVLAGGRSVRMGRDKSLLPFDGLPLITRAARILQDLLQEVIVVADDPEKYRFLSLEVIPDLYKGTGPLGGIHAALKRARTDAVFVSSCDTPLVPRQLAEYMLNSGTPLRTRIPRHLGVLQPLFGIYHQSLLPLLERNLLDGNFRVLSVLEQAGFETLDITPDLPFFTPDVFSNVNRPEDYFRTQRLFKKSNGNDFQRTSRSL